MASIDDIFSAAVLLPESDRSAYLDAVCENPHQRDEVVALLQDADSASDWFAELEPAAKPPAPNEGPGTVIDNYKLLERIGEGGFGVVFLAEQFRPMVRQVALKVIRQGMDTEQVIARFNAERQALALLDHPNIARILDAGATETGRPYFVMELVRGVPITTFCNDRKLDTRQRLEVFSDVCSAINHAHQKGIIHRDLKPSNILVALDGDEAVPKVIDFGIAKATQQKLTDRTLVTRIEQFVGTPAYVSPEQAAMGGVDVDTRADIYSLGSILYELLAGKSAFDAATLMNSGYDEMRRIIREKDPPKPSTRVGSLTQEERVTIASTHRTDLAKLRVQLRGDIDWIVMKALEKDRSRRYATANAFAEDIRRYLHNEPVSAVAPTAFYKFRKYARRHRGQLAAIVIILLSLIGGTIVSLWQANRASRARDEARLQERLATDNARATTAALYESLVNDIRATREIHKPGWRRDAFEKLRRALSLDTPARSMPQLRSEAISCLEGLDVMPIKAFDDARAIWDLDLSPDGRYLATASSEHHPSGPPVDLTLRVWDVESEQKVLELTGEALGPPLSPKDPASQAHGRCISRFVPGAKTPTLIFSLPRRPLQIHTLNGEPTSIRLPGKSAWTEAEFVDIDESGERLAVSWLDATAGVYDLNTGAPIIDEVPTARPNGWENPNPVALSRNGKWLVTTDPGGMSVTKRSTDGTPARTFGPLSSPLRSLSLEDQAHPQPLLTASCDDGSTYAWDFDDGTMLFAVNSHTSKIQENAIAPDGSLLATCADDGMLRLFDTTSGRPLVDVIGRDGPLLSTGFSDDGRLIATGGMPLRVFQLDPGKVRRTLRGHASDVDALKFHPGRNLLFSGSTDTTAMAWDLESTPERAKALPINFPPNRVAALIDCNEPANLIAISSKGQFRSNSDSDDSIYLYRIGESEPFHRLSCDHGDLSSLAFDPEGTRILSGHHDGTLCIAPVSPTESGGNAQSTLTFEEPFSGVVRGLGFIEDGTRVVAASSNHLTGRVAIYDLADRKLLRARELDLPFTCVAFDEVNGRVALGMDDGGLRVLNLADLTTSGPDVPARNGRMSTLSFSPAGELLVGGGADGVAKVWSCTTDIPEELFVLPALRTGLISVAFSPDCRWIAVAAAEKQIELWDLTAIQSVFAELDGRMEIPSIRINPTTTGAAPLTGLQPVPSNQARAALDTKLREAGLDYSLWPDGNRGLRLEIRSPRFDDLSILEGFPVTQLSVIGTRVSDLTPLRELPLTNLDISATKVTDLSPLSGLPLAFLRVTDTEVSDLKPLTGMPLAELHLYKTRVADVSPLSGLPLRILHLSTTSTRDISALEGLPLNIITLDNTPVEDLSPLSEIKSLQQVMLPDQATNIGLLRPLPHLEYISKNWDPVHHRPDMTADEFWARSDR